MQIIAGETAVITGASRGLGVYMARRLAAKGVNLVLAARSTDSLEEVSADIRTRGVEVIAVPTDVSVRAELEYLVYRATEEFGSIDLLVKNAGIECTSRYELLTLDEIEQALEVNLTAPMILTRLVLPAMLARDQGHIVNIASIAGVLVPAYAEAYAATKSGLISFTRSLRLSAKDRRSSVSASVVCPGFMEGAGMYERNKHKYGIKAPRLLGGSLRGEKAADAVVRAVEQDLPEVMVQRGTPRFSMAVSAMFPRLSEKIATAFGLCRGFKKIAERRAEERVAAPTVGAPHTSEHREPAAKPR
jgi:short-subunit dehydrogenase